MNYSTRRILMFIERKVYYNLLNAKIVLAFEVISIKFSSNILIDNDMNETKELYNLILNITEMNKIY
jgi:hypothetical protein